MQSTAKTADDYIAELPLERRKIISDLRNILLTSLPIGFGETMQHGMISYVVPHSLYPAGYHCKPSDALPFISLASQKNHIALYHMGIYADENLLKWFTGEYPKYSSKKLDMGKSCIKWKKPEDIPLDLIGKLAQKMTAQEWIEQYEKTLKNS